MIIPDANLLIYAHDRKVPQHRRAKSWWEQTLSGTKAVGIPWVVVLAFTRVMTHPTICEQPLSIIQTRELVRAWFDADSVRLIQLSDHALSRFFDLLEQAGHGGNLSTDALIALHAFEYSGVIYSNDRDFDRFPGIQRINPLD